MRRSQYLELRTWRKPAILTLALAAGAILHGGNTATALLAHATARQSMISSSSAGARATNPPDSLPGELFARLELTKEQSRQISVLSRALRDTLVEIRKREVADGQITEAGRAALRRAGTAHNDSVRTLLSPSQRTVLESWMVERRTSRAAAARARLQASRLSTRGTP